jgi:hypothetical protein
MKQNREEIILTAQSQEELHARIRDAKKKFKNGIILAVTTLIAIIFVCIAWFLNNARVSAEGIGLISNVQSFELVSEGENAGKLENLLKNKALNWENGWSLGTDVSKQSDINLSNGFMTDENNTQINWMMTADSNLNNATDSENTGIYPGASGQLTFYVVPKQDGDMTIEFELSMELYQKVQETNGNTQVKQTDGENTNIQKLDDETAKKLVSGHLMFFENEENGIYSGWIQNGTFSKTFKNAKKDQPEEVTIYWVWPYVFSQTILENGDKHLLGRNNLFGDEVRSQIKTDMITSLNSDASVSYFYDSDSSVIREVITDSILEEMLNNGTYASSVYSEISRFYNNADQYIGLNVNYMLLRLDAVSQ